MNIQAYRRQFAEELEEAAARRTSFRDRVADSGPIAERHLTEPQSPSRESDTALAIAVLDDREQSVALRSAALHQITARFSEQPEQIERLLGVLHDAAEPIALRNAALTAVQAISFQAVTFAPYRPAYLATLRSIVDDPDPELRQRALGILAREKDDYAQRRLLEGLEDPSKALVPVAKAIQFFGYDVHAEHFPILRRIVEQPPTQAAKREAVRVLAADPSSSDMLTGLLTDKSESREVRLVSAAALQSLAPDRFDNAAREIVLDTDEDDTLRIASLNALTHFQSIEEHPGDNRFVQSVERLRDTSESPKLKRAMTEYLSKHGA